jgi:hypothetical protein
VLALGASRATSDVKELIPEFYYLPEFLLNADNFELGTRSSATSSATSCCRHGPRLGAPLRAVMREALESEFVSAVAAQLDRPHFRLSAARRGGGGGRQRLPPADVRRH